VAFGNLKLSCSRIFRRSSSISFELFPFDFHQRFFTMVKAPVRLIERNIRQRMFRKDVGLKIILPDSGGAAWTKRTDEWVVGAWLLRCEFAGLADM
jgi:hypothetical protein